MKNKSGFTAKIEIIGVNPFVFVPGAVLSEIFKKSGREKSPIPVCGKINGRPYRQTLVKYKGEWRLYINTIMLKNSPKHVGEKIVISAEYDPVKREIPVHPALQKALNKNPEAKKVFESLIPSRRLEIVRYISFLKTEESIIKNVERAINFLKGKQRFIGRNKP
jgi:hypothetical protein